MCLSIPAKVISIEGETALVSVGGARQEANLQMVEGVVPGDYILLHTGFALEKVDEKEAEEILQTYRDYTNLKVDE